MKNFKKKFWDRFMEVDEEKGMLRFYRGNRYEFIYLRVAKCQP